MRMTLIKVMSLRQGAMQCVNKKNDNIPVYPNSLPFDHDDMGMVVTLMMKKTMPLMLKNVHKLLKKKDDENIDNDDNEEEWHHAIFR